MSLASTKFLSVLGCLSLLSLHSCDFPAKVEEQASQPDAGVTSVASLSGRVVKYLDADRHVLSSEKQAVYCRSAFYSNDSIVVDSLVQDFKTDGSLVFEGHLSAEDPDVYVGECMWYNRQGLVEKHRYDGKDNSIHVHHKRYYRNGVLFSESHYLDSLIIWSKAYYQSSALKESCNYAAGKMDGAQKAYYENGRLMSVTSWNKGVLSGSYKEYYSNGRQKVVGRYKDNVKVGTWRYFDEQGGSVSYCYSAHTDNAVKEYEMVWNECVNYQNILYSNNIPPYSVAHTSMSLQELKELRQSLVNQIEGNGLSNSYRR